MYRRLLSMTTLSPFGSFLVETQHHCATLSAISFPCSCPRELFAHVWELRGAHQWCVGRLVGSGDTLVDCLVCASVSCTVAVQYHK